MPARIVVLAGVNGAGKSSVTGTAILQGGGAFYNPDAAARALLEHSADLTQEQANAQAWALGRNGLQRALARNEFFAFETTLGARTIPALLIAGAEQGAEIHVSFVGLSTPELHVARVKSRVAAGGHDIPEAKIRERYTSSRENLIRLLPHLASLQVYDNSAECDLKSGETPRPTLLLHLSGGRLVQHAPLDRIPDWAKPVLGAALMRFDA